MSGWALLLIPVLVAPVVLLLAFTGCEPFGSPPPDPAPTQPPGTTPPPVTPPTPPVTPTPATYADVIKATPGLVAYWRLGEAAGTTALDAGPFAGTPTSHDGAYLGGVTLQGSGGALVAKDAADRTARFDGDDDSIQVDGAMALNPLSFSIEAWVNHSVNGQQIVVSSWTLGANVARGFDLALYGDEVRARLGDGDSVVDLTTTITTADGAWHHVVVTFSGSVTGTGPLSLYWDGALANTQVVTYSPNTDTAQPFRIGTGPRVYQPTVPGVTNYFAGALDEIAIYNVALPAATVAAHRTAAL